jgi:hypothetical protein
MRLIVHLLRWLFAASLVFGVGAALAAVLLRGRLTSRGGPNDEEVELVAIFDARDFTSSASPFRRADVTALYGGGTLDLRLATLEADGGTVHVRAAFGGYQVFVPPTWRVEIRGIGIAGGFGDGRDRTQVDRRSPVLTIDGWALFGGVGVVSETLDSRSPHGEGLDAAPGDEQPVGLPGLVTDIERA